MAKKVRKKTSIKKKLQKRRVSVVGRKPGEVKKRTPVKRKKMVRKKQEKKPAKRVLKKRPAGKSVKKTAVRKKVSRKKEPAAVLNTKPKQRARPRTDAGSALPRRRGPSRKRSAKSFIRIKVVGVGGGGGNAVSRMRRHFAVRGVEFVAINTDVQDLETCEAHRKLNIGRALTKGMGAGMNPELGQQAAEENRSEIAEVLKDADMIFLTAGFGGGTGTGATPVIADVAREMGILTVAIVTKPFQFEGAAREKIADDGVSRVRDRVDTLLVIPNDRIFNIIDKNTSVLKAFERIDDILKSAVQGVAEIVSSSGLVNVDFADVRTVMAGAGVAVIGVGTASGADRAVKAVNQAIHSPLLDISIDGARSVLFGVSGRSDLKMAEINEAAKIITDSIDPGAKIIFGAYYDRKLRAGQFKVTLIAAGFDGMAMRREPPSLTLFAGEEEPPEHTAERGEKTTEKEAETEPEEKKPKKPAAKAEAEDEDIWDIPAFLRKKGRR